MSNDEGLDLASVPSEDLEVLAGRIESFYRSDAGQKSQLSWAWERNHLFLDGQQWLVFDGDRETGGLWKRLKVSKSNEFIPRPCTNFIFSSYQTLKSYLIKNKPRITVTPNTQTYKDKTAAKVATLVSEVNWERLHEEENYEYAAACLVSYGTVFKKSYWDTSTLCMVKVPKMQIQPQTDPTTGQVVGMIPTPVLDPQTGQPLYDELPLGDVNSDVVEPYRMTIDPLATTLAKARWLIEYNIQPISWIMEMFDKEGPGYTGLAKEVMPEGTLNQTMQRFYNLRTSSGIKSFAGTGSSGESADSMLKDACVVKEYYERPSPQYPKGRLVIVANGKTLYAHDSPCSGTELGDWHPYSECRWELKPGRFWGVGPLDAGIEIQKRINSIDSIVILNRKTMAVPQKLIPIGSGLQPGQWTGRPGQEIFVRDTNSALQPQTIPGAGLDPQVLQERAQAIQDLKDITGAIDILKGDRPAGVTAYTALNLLYEVGTGKLFPVLDRWKKFIECDQKKQLKLVAKNFQEPREEFIRALKAKNAELSEDSIAKFIGMDLYDNSNAVVEAGSNIPKLQASHQAMLMELAKTGVLNLELPTNRMEFQRQLGITGFDNDIGPDVKRAEFENDKLDDTEKNPAQQCVVLDADDDRVHTDVHQRRMKQPDFESMPFEVQKAYTDHIMAHEASKAKKAQAEMMQAMAMGASPDAAQSPPANAPRPLHPAGTGITKEQKNSLLGDGMQAATLGRQ